MKKPRVVRTCFHDAVQVVGALIFTHALFGCVSSPEVKLASTQMTAALKSAQDAQEKFKRAYIKEIDKTRNQVESAIIARAVRQQVTSLANQETIGDLLSISQKVDEAQFAARAMVAEISRLDVQAGANVEGEATKFFQEKIASLRQTAESLPIQAATELREKANQLEAGKGLSGYVRQEDLLVLLRLAVMKAEVETNLKDLAQNIAALRKIHATIDTWIMTDVTVSGQEVAELVDKHSAILGLAGTVAERGKK